MDEHSRKTTTPSEIANLNADLNPAPPLERFGRYERLEFLGQGGMARVYKAFDPVLGRTVALKFIKGDDPLLAERLLMEARAQARLEHEHLCRVYEVGEIDGIPYIAMQYINGRTLAVMKDELTLPQKIKIMIDVAWAVHAAHRSGLIHRDLKPSNVMVERTEEGDWKPCVMDFGLAREVEAPGMTATGTIVGSPSYMSPEQARGEVHKLDRRSDVFTLGITLYELLCGSVPFDGAGSLEILLNIDRSDPLPLRKRDASIPLDLETIVMKCLEKDLSRRYDSAKAFADDLKRYQDGVPIEARQAGVVDRLFIRARRNKPVVIAAGVAVLAIAIFGGVALRARWKAAEEARLAGLFGEEVQLVEATMRQAYLLPLHDTTPEKKVVLAKMAWIEDRMKSADTAHGAGEYALGRGYMVLRDYSQAGKRLELAWNQYGLQTPQVAQALGLTMAMLFQKELSEVNRITDKALRDRKIEELDREYKTPALEFIARGRTGDAGGAQYAEALIAFLEKHYDQALKKAEKAFAQTPSFYESELLVGDIYVALGNERRDKGDNQAAQEFYSKGEAAYHKAIRSGESDPIAYEALCSLKLDLMTMQIYQTGSSLDAAFEAATQTCDDAIKTNPESASAWTKKSAALARRAEAAFALGQKPMATIQQSIDAAQQALKFDPVSATALYAMSRPYWIKGMVERNMGLDQRGSFHKVIQYTQRVTQVDPADSRSYNLMGLAYANIGLYERNGGLDPRPMLEKSVDSFKRSLAINPKSAIAYSNTAISYLYKAHYEMGHGIDPSRSIQAIIDSSRKAIEINPNYSYGYNQLGLGYIARAEYKIQTGDDPQEDLKTALQALGKILEITPNYYQAHGNLGYTNVLLALYQVIHGLDPRNSLERAMKDLQIAVEKGNATIVNFDWFGIAFLQKAEYERLRGLDPSKSLQGAMNQFQKSCDLNPKAADEFGGICSAYLGQAYLKQGSFMLSRREDPEKALQQADAFLQQALAINPQHFLTLRLRAETDLLRGRWEMSRHRSPSTSFEVASSGFQRSAGVNPRDTETWADMAQLCLWRAEWKTGDGALPAQEDVDQGLEMTGKALEVNPQMARALVIRGELCRMQERLVQDPEKRKEWNQRSSDAFQKAGRINPLLKASEN